MRAVGSANHARENRQGVEDLFDRQRQAGKFSVGEFAPVGSGVDVDDLRGVRGTGKDRDLDRVGEQAQPDVGFEAFARQDHHRDLLRRL